MKINSITLRTIYDITFTLEDLKAIVQHAKESTHNYSHAFIKEEEWTEEELEGKFVYNGFSSSELDYITRYFGYTNWSHAGYPDGENKYTFTVYNPGDTLN